jgi:transcriptional regulator with XRE-family HTH domain
VNLDLAIDLHIGQRLRERRRSLGLGQPEVADAVGVRFQQIQKYECGEDRISASRLWRLCMVLKTPVSYFYEGLELTSRTRDFEALDECDARREALDLARVYQELDDLPRKALLDLAKTLSGPRRPH